MDVIPNHVVSLCSSTFIELRNYVEHYPFSEVRLDLIPLTFSELIAVFRDKTTKTIVTCRETDENTYTRSSAIATALQHGSNYVDIEMESPVSYRTYIFEVAKYYDRKVIMSYHNYNNTPDLSLLQTLEQEMSAFAPDIIKIVTTVNDTSKDCDTLRELYEKSPQPSRLIAFGMGDAGKISRMNCLKYGAPFTYVAISHDKKTASGQSTAEELQNFLRPTIR